MLIDAWLTNGCVIIMLAIHFLVMISVVDSMTNTGMRHGWLLSSGGWCVSDAPLGGSLRTKGREWEGGVAVGDGMSIVVLDRVFANDDRRRQHGVRPRGERLAVEFG